MNIGAPEWTPSDGSSVFEFPLDREPGAGAAARRQLDGLADLLPTSTLHDLRSVITELVNNSVSHGEGGPITVIVEVTPRGTTRGTITDGGEGPVAIAAAREVGDGGLGLRIVDALASRWGVSAPSSEIWFEFAPVY
jgi:anti-sigma regulatory factor (Ser/Thr protein kinase)